jgi:ankyrin repeat protein
VRKRIIVAVALGILAALSSAYALTTDFVELVKTGTPQQIQAAIDKGEDVNAQDKNGLTPLMWAAGFNQNSEAITTLLKAGADVKARDNAGKTPLMYAAAASYPSPEVITALLGAGADAKPKDNLGHTAIEYAHNNFDFGRSLEKTDAYRKLEEASQ